MTSEQRKRMALSLQSLLYPAELLEKEMSSGLLAMQAMLTINQASAISPLQCVSIVSMVCSCDLIDIVCFVQLYRNRPNITVFERPRVIVALDTCRSGHYTNKTQNI